MLEATAKTVLPNTATAAEVSACFAALRRMCPGNPN